MSESLRNDGRVWVPIAKGDKRPPPRFRMPSVTIIWNAVIRHLEISYLAIVLLAQPKQAATLAMESGPRAWRCFWIFRTRSRDGENESSKRYGNLFDMYNEITTKILTQVRCEFSLPPITPWGTVGRLQSDEQGAWYVRSR